MAGIAFVAFRDVDLDENGDEKPVIESNETLGEFVRSALRDDRFWRLMLFTALLIGVRMVFRHLDATFPKVRGRGVARREGTAKRQDSMQSHAPRHTSLACARASLGVRLWRGAASASVGRLRYFGSQGDRPPPPSDAHLPHSTPCASWARTCPTAACTRSTRCWSSWRVR